jgi:hypothetical protein
MGLRERTLTLPVMVALVLSMIWRQNGSIFDLTRIVQQETLLWVKPTANLTDKAIASRLRTLPSDLFWHVLFELLPLMLNAGKSANVPCHLKWLGHPNNTVKLQSVMVQRSMPFCARWVCYQKQL